MPPMEYRSPCICRVPLPGVYALLLPPGYTTPCYPPSSRLHSTVSGRTVHRR